MKKGSLRIFFGILALLILVSASFASEAQDVFAENGMVAAANRLASEAGVEILKQGGNAVDAAVATALALNVVESNASGIGGGGFATIRLKNGEIYCWDFREVAPASATKDLFSSEQSKKELWSENGGKAIGVPGSVAGLFTLLKAHGTMSFAQVAAPAIRLAEEGFPADPLLVSFIQENFERLSTYQPDGTPYTPDGLPIEVGAILKQPKLGATFRLLAEKGPDEFYRGPIGRAVVEAVNRSGGNMTMEDLASYKVEAREPVTGTYRGYTVVAPPPASSAGTHIIQMLNVMENFPVSKWGHNSERYLHHLAETSKMMFADRGRYMADTAFVDVPIRGLISKEYAKAQADSIGYASVKNAEAGDPFRYQSAGKVAYAPAGEHNTHQSTTHFSVLDEQGNMVAWTWTINYFFGSGVFVPEYGFMLNNEMDDFSTDATSVNAPERGKRPLSSMSPTLVLDPSGKPFMAVGSPGATRIILAITQIIMNAVDFGMTMDEAIEASRLFNSNGGKLAVETPGISGSTLDVLRLRGHDVEEWKKDLYFGGAQGIMLKGGKIIGGADSRRNGEAVGY